MPFGSARPSDVNKTNADGGSPPPPVLSYRGAALDVSQGIFFERWALPDCGPDAILQSKRYAHREHRSLLVWQLSALNATKACNVSLSSCTRAPSGMVTLSPGVYQVSDPEQPADPSFPRNPAAIVAIASNAPGEFSPAAAEEQAPPPAPWVVTMATSSPPTLFLAVVRTTLEPGVNPSRSVRYNTSIHRSCQVQHLPGR